MASGVAAALDLVEARAGRGVAARAGIGIERGKNVARDLLVFQSMQRGAREVEPIREDYGFWDFAAFDRPGFPRLHFVEHRYAGDPTNWWIPNRACVEALLRSAGFEVVAHAEEEVFVCRRKEPPPGEEPRAVYPARGQG